jgi:hypothetical protein
MPIFSRRRLQRMIDDLGATLPETKSREMIGRLDGKNTKHAMSTEAELALTWAVGRVRHIVIEPEFKSTTKRIDLAAYMMFGTEPAAVEITALSDDNFSGREDMERAASIISQCANRYRKKAERHLHFTFANSGSYVIDARTKRSSYRRVRHVSPIYKLIPEHDAVIRTWVSDPAWPSPKRIRLNSDLIDVVIEWRESVHPEGRTFCSMPPVAYDLRDNPLYKQLKRKDDQLRDVPMGLVRCVFVVDAGSHLLRHLQPMSSTGQEKGGAEIIHQFLKHAHVDVVCVFSQHRPPRILGLQPQPKLQWRVNYFDRRPNPPREIRAGLEAIANELPRPNLEAYAARSLHRQGAFTPEDIKGLGGYKLQTGRHGMTIEISSRLLHGLLAGQISREEFEQRSFRDGANPFALQALRGKTLRGVELRPSGDDTDDDWVAFHLSSDPAVGALRPAPRPDVRARLKAWITRAVLPIMLWARQQSTRGPDVNNAKDADASEGQQKERS